MSDGPRISLADAEKAAAYVFHRWALDPETCFVVGSVRRRRPDVGDLELLAPAWDGTGRDALFERIAATMEGEHLAYKPEPVRDLDLFGPPPAVAVAPLPTVIRGANPIGAAVLGLKPGFLTARLRLWRRDRSLPPVPCEVYRYTPDNLGWMMVMRTGPGDFGRAFLTYWKTRFGIPMGDAGRASIEGHLVDSTGAVVPTPSEAAAFEKCGLGWMAPERRDEFARDWTDMQRRTRR